MEGLNFECVAFVPVENKSRPQNPENAGDDKQPSNGRDAGSEDENRCKDEKKAGYATSDRYAVH